jgi:tetratricopeptide (TPR) repeat protein
MVSPGSSDDPAGQTSADAKVYVGLAPNLTASSPTGPGPTLSSSSGLSRKVTGSASKPTPEGMADAGADLVDSPPIGQNEADAFDTVPHPNEPKRGEHPALFEGPDIADARMELEECPPEDPDRVNVLNRLARALFLNFQETGQEAFLLECIDIGRYICSTGPHACLDPSMDEADTYANLAMALETRYEQTGDVAAFNEALAVNRCALALRSPGHAKRFIPCASLNRIIFTRMSRAPEDVSVEEILAFCTELSLLLPSRPSDAEATTCSDVASYLQHCYDRTEDPHHLDEAIKFAEEARLLTSPGHPAYATMYSNLSVLLWSRFRLTRDESCADEAVALDREALELTPVGHPDRAQMCEGVMHSLGERLKFTGNGSPLDDEESVALGREALALRPQGHPARVRTCIYLSNAVFQCFEAARDTETPLLKEAVTLQREVLALTPRGHSFRAMACINLARSLVAHRAETQLIDEAIALGREAVELRPPGHPLRANACASLSVSLMAQFTITNDTSTLVEYVGLTREAATSSSRMYPGGGSALYHLADGLHMLFDSTGDKAVLDEAMARSKQSLDLRQKGHAATFAQLAALAGTRATYTGYRSLLDDAIAYKEQQISMEHDLERERLCATQATLFSMMFRRTGNVTFLDRAIVLEREALSLSPHGHPLRHVNCGCLSASLQVHYIETGSKASLLEAITLLREQRLLMSDDNPHLPHVLTALAKALIMLFDEVGGDSLAEEALTLYHTALESLPQDSPIRWVVLTALTWAHADHRSPSFDMATAVKYLHEALSSTAHLPAELLGEVSRCLDRIDIAVVPASSHALLLRCFSAVIDLSSLIAGYAPDRTSQLVHLYVFADLGRRAWEFASLVGQHEAGLELLERARGVMWWQSLQVRNPDLASAPPKFAAELVESVRIESR